MASLAQTAGSVKGLGIGAALLLVSAGVVYLVFRGPKLVKDAAQAINPLNQDNVFASLANETTRALSGDSDATLGTKIFDFFNPSSPAVDDAARLEHCKNLYRPGMRPPVNGGCYGLLDRAGLLDDGAVTVEEDNGDPFDF